VGRPVVRSDRGASAAGCPSCAAEEIPPGAALVATALLKVSLESVAKTLVQRGRPPETVSDMILRGNSAAHGLSFPSGHVMVIFAITALVYPYLKDWSKVLPWALVAAVCLSRMYLGAHFPLDVVAGAGLGILIGSVLNLVFGAPSISPRLPAPTGSSSTRTRRAAAEHRPISGSPRSRGPPAETHPFTH
jgi:membrane-associated phospholipid phosphatase